MSKKEYIEKYGEDAWNKKLEADREYRKNHKEYLKEYRKQYYAKNRDKLIKDSLNYAAEHKTGISARMKKYYAENREGKRGKSKKYYEENKEEINAKARIKYLENRETRKAYAKEYRDLTDYNKKYRGTINGKANNLIASYKRVDRLKGQTNDLDREWVIKHILNSRCIYCGETDWHYLGCDRIDNNLPHTKDNCICSCGICNVERADRFTVEEFVKYRQNNPRHIDLKPNIVEKDGIFVLKKHIPASA